MLKRTPSLTEQAKVHIKQLILDDAFEDGRIPSETDLASDLGVSRTTVRDALSRLESEGVVYRKQGAGTFINEAGLQIKSRLDEIWSYEAMLADHGYVPSTQILDVSTKPVSPDIAAELNLKDGEELLVIKKLFLADAQPVILAYNHIPTKLIAQPYTNDDLLSPVYNFLWANGQHLAYYLSEIVPMLISTDMAATLHIHPQTPLISFTEIGYNDDNVPIIKSTSYFRDDLLRLRLIRRQIPG
ncbi:MAG: GntR family transcriptional regulator [Ardenticatenaceae bacterium]|nr:GntR family transcriptional regulator [Anaerolineales bacterium]MCB8923200.1 GntR family transcriptional regulator [Ardenticatenaceae bacterium]MCB9004855.1 GntR family transcriptional regulator [Ardenticatenaceae bacterium]